MSIDYQQLKDWELPQEETTYSARDTILYALALGLGADPTDASQLPFVFEEGLKALPTMPLTLAYPGFWLKDPATGVDWQQTLHGEQSIEIHAPLPAAGTVVGRIWVDEVLDKGPQKGALVYARASLTDKATGKLLCSLATTMFCRADGGFGGPAGPAKEVHRLPDRLADDVCDLPTLPWSALLYRLTGDFNPLHASPAVAQSAGFERPILHGLCTFGVAGHALLRTLCGYEPSRMRRMDARFSAPVYPGETIRTEIWRETEGRASFRCRVVERDLVVLNNGLYEYN
ncbi:Acyl dehydratase [Burkholderia sp. YR290]|nr:Acyl dehydratase [Burkholderia sp. YR290]